MQEYADFTVDSRPPVFRKLESQKYRQRSFDDYKREHIEKHGEPIREVRRNNGKGRQFRCKVCSTTFTENVMRSDEVGCYCSYYKERLAMRGTAQADSLKTLRNQELIPYNYREFKFTLEKIRNAEDRYPTPSEAIEGRRSSARSMPIGDALA